MWFSEIFFVGTEHNFQQSGTTDWAASKQHCEHNTQIYYRWNIGENYLCNFIQLRRNILLKGTLMQVWKSPYVFVFMQK